MPDPTRPGAVVDVPPSGHVAGQFAYHDLRTGVHRAPANARLQWALDSLAHPDRTEQERLNDAHVNLIRQEPGRGLRIMGARTLSSDPKWRFVNVRRLVLQIKTAAELLTQWAVFEPNTAATRTRLTAVLEGFLGSLWERGALTGATPEQGYFVRCDEENNPSASRDLGRLVVDVGLAPAVPFEFIVLRVGLQENSLRIEEMSALARAA